MNAVDGIGRRRSHIHTARPIHADGNGDGVAEAFSPIGVTPVSSLPTPSFSNLSAPVVTYGTGSTTISGQLQANGADQTIPAGETVQVTVNGVTQNATLASDDSFSTSFATSTLGVSSSPYAISFSYAGDTNFNGATDSSTLTVQQATPAVSVSDAGGTYNSGIHFRRLPLSREWWRASTTRQHQSRGGGTERDLLCGFDRERHTAARGANARRHLHGGRGLCRSADCPAPPAPGHIHCGRLPTGRQRHDRESGLVWHLGQ